jgi:hypothetical protein
LDAFATVLVARCGGRLVTAAVRGASGLLAHRLLATGCSLPAVRRPWRSSRQFPGCHSPATGTFLTASSANLSNMRRLWRHGVATMRDDSG